MCHAEFESYFESVSMQILNKAEILWKSKTIANYNLAALFVNHEKIEASDTVKTKGCKIISEFYKSIEQNHGIRKNNIKLLFYSLGYVEDDFEDNFLNALDSFGVLRGEIAHSAVNKVKTTLDKCTVIKQIDELLSFISNFEKAIENKFGKNTEA